MTDDTLLRLCKVVSVEDEQGGGRIKVRIEPYDNPLTDSELPYCFPLLPKHFAILPKVGESVIVLLTHISGHQGNRYFIGPVISQQYNLNYDPHDYQARVFLKGQEGVIAKPLPNPDNNPENEGGYPEIEDVAVQGRKNADLILKENEVRLRCGFKKYPDGQAEKSLEYNTDDPAYIQMRYKQLLDRKMNEKYSSTINIVADRINLISHDSKTPVKTNDPKELLNEETMDKIMMEGHPVPYGDSLVELLKEIRHILLTHVHPFNGLQPCWREPWEYKLNNRDLEDILSQGVRVN